MFSRHVFAAFPDLLVLFNLIVSIQPTKNPLMKYQASKRAKIVQKRISTIVQRYMMMASRTRGHRDDKGAVATL